MMKVRHVNALLMEILLAVLIFALASVVILNLFAAGHELSARADALDRGMNHARQVSERLYGSEDVPSALAECGFVQEGALWRFTAENYTLEAELEREMQPAGVIWQANIRVCTSDGETFTLPCARYIAEEAGA